MATHSGIPARRIPVDSGAWRATQHRVAKSWTQVKQLNTHTVKASVAQSCPTLRNPMGQPARLFCLWDHLGRKTSGLPRPPPGDVPDPGIKPEFLT